MKCTLFESLFLTLSASHAVLARSGHGQDWDVSLGLVLTGHNWDDTNFTTSIQIPGSTGATGSNNILTSTKIITSVITSTIQGGSSTQGSTSTPEASTIPGSASMQGGTNPPGISSTSGGTSTQGNTSPQGSTSTRSSTSTQQITNTQETTSTQGSSSTPGSTTTPGSTNTQETTSIQGSTSIPATTSTTETVSESTTSGSSTASNSACPLQDYKPTVQEWLKYDVDLYLDEEFFGVEHQEEMDSLDGGFAEMVGQRAAASSHFFCTFGGEHNECNFDPCQIISTDEIQMQKDYLLLRSLQNLRSFFSDLALALEARSLTSPLTKDKWSNALIPGERDEEFVLKTNFISTAMFAGMTSASPNGGGPPLVSGHEGATNAGMTGALGALLNILKTSPPPLPGNIKGPDLGRGLAHVVLSTAQLLRARNDELMKGRSFAGIGDSRKFLAQGAFVNRQDINVDEFVVTVLTWLYAGALNNSWRLSTTFVIGGADCDKASYIGYGPQQAKWCDEADNKVWYLEAIDADFNYTAPPNVESLGKPGFLQNVTVADVLRSSVYAFKNTGYRNKQRHQMPGFDLQEDISHGIYPGMTPTGYNGAFNLPVCDLSVTIQNYGHDKKVPAWKDAKILADYGYEMKWCGSVCGYGWETMSEFLHAAHLQDMESRCPVKVDLTHAGGVVNI